MKNIRFREVHGKGKGAYANPKMEGMSEAPREAECDELEKD